MTFHNCRTLISCGLLALAIPANAQPPEPKTMTEQSTPNRHEAFFREAFMMLGATPEKYFAPDAPFYLWGPDQPALVGPAAIKAFMPKMGGAFSAFRMEDLSYAEAGDMIYYERIDHGTTKDGKVIAMPIVTVAKIGADGKFEYVKEYYDITPMKEIGLGPDAAGSN